jgi:hypothetical protein
VLVAAQQIAGKGEGPKSNEEGGGGEDGTDGGTGDGSDGGERASSIGSGGGGSGGGGSGGGGSGGGGIGDSGIGDSGSGGVVSATAVAVATAEKAAVAAMAAVVTKARIENKKGMLMIASPMRQAARKMATRRPPPCFKLRGTRRAAMVWAMRPPLAARRLSIEPGRSCWKTK